MSRHAKILGAGIAGLTGAHLLSRCGWTVDLTGSGPTPERWATLSSQTLKLIDKLWGSDILAESAHYPLQGRSVSWSGVDAHLVAEPLCAVELSSLTAAMRRSLAANLNQIVFLPDSRSAAAEMETADAAVIIEARGRAPSIPANRVRAGNRHMRVWSVLEMNSPAGAIAEIVTGRAFWSFAFPIAADLISLQIAVPRPCSSAELRSMVHDVGALDGSVLRQATSQIPDLFERNSSDFSIAPTLARDISTSKRLAIGDALMTLDPICGDGVGQGVKSALLAVGVVNSAGATVTEEAAVAHFKARSSYAFRVHLRHCAAYYGSVAHPECWRNELDWMEAAAADATYENPKGNLILEVDAHDHRSVGDLRVRLVADVGRDVANS